METQRERGKKKEGKGKKRKKKGILMVHVVVGAGKYKSV